MRRMSFGRPFHNSQTFRPEVISMRPLPGKIDDHTDTDWKSMTLWFAIKGLTAGVCLTAVAFSADAIGMMLEDRQLAFGWWRWLLAPFSVILLPGLSLGSCFVTEGKGLLLLASLLPFCFLVNSVAGLCVGVLLAVLRCYKPEPCRPDSVVPRK